MTAGATSVLNAQNGRLIYRDSRAKSAMTAGISSSIDPETSRYTWAVPWPRRLSALHAASGRNVPHSALTNARLSRGERTGIRYSVSSGLVFRERLSGVRWRLSISSVFLSQRLIGSFRASSSTPLALPPTPLLFASRHILVSPICLSTSPIASSDFFRHSAAQALVVPEEVADAFGQFAHPPSRRRPCFPSSLARSSMSSTTSFPS